LDRISEAKPEKADEDSLTFLTWQAVHERVRMESGLDDDDEFETFGKLMETRLACYFDDSLAHFSSEDTPGKITMHQLPQNPKARQRLRRVKSLGVSGISSRHWAVFGLIFVGVFTGGLKKPDKGGF
ncbi:MAG: hypothetical protein GY710_08080, partial [Desulfobacteraceae bacterium]|nr:hypothetical protein [Desulfobacteraceae bacterium]